MTAPLMAWTSGASDGSAWLMSGGRSVGGAVCSAGAFAWVCCGGCCAWACCFVPLLHPNAATTSAAAFHDLVHTMSSSSGSSRGKSMRKGAPKMHAAVEKSRLGDDYRTLMVTLLDFASSFIQEDDSRNAAGRTFDWEVRQAGGASRF